MCHVCSRSQAAGTARRGAGLACGACGSLTRGLVDPQSSASRPAFLCRACSCVNVFAPPPGAPPVEVHIHAREATKLGNLHYVSVSTGGDTNAAQPPLSCVSFPVFNALPKVVVGARGAYTVAPRRRDSGDAARGAFPAAAVPDLTCGQPLVVRLGAGDAGGAPVRVFAQQEGTGPQGPWDEIERWTAQPQLSALCAALAAQRGLAAAAGTGTAASGGSSVPVVRSTGSATDPRPRSANPPAARATNGFAALRWEGGSAR